MDDAGVIVAIVGVGVALLGVLSPLLLSIRSDVKALRAEIAALRAEVIGIDKRLVAVETTLHERSGDVTDFSQQVALQYRALTGYPHTWEEAKRLEQIRGGPAGTETTD